VLRARLFVSEALGSIRSNLSTSIAATMTVLIGMFLLGLFIALGTWVLSYTNDLKRQIQVNVFFESDASDREINAVARKLQAMPEVEKLEFVSKEEALRIMKKRFPELTEAVASNPLPPAFKVTPTEAEQKEVIVAKLEPLPAGVDEVRTEKEKSEKIIQVGRIVGVIFLTGSVILLVASTILIANTIRLSIFSRRREIEVMKLVGATNWFVRGPFMLEGLLCGLVGSIAAVVLLLVAREFALPQILERDTNLSDPDVRALSFPLMALILVGTSLVVGAAGSGITLRRFLRV
jgi:cell division transport system permease protein